MAMYTIRKFLVHHIRVILSVLFSQKQMFKIFLFIGKKEKKYAFEPNHISVSLYQLA